MVIDQSTINIAIEAILAGISIIAAYFAIKALAKIAKAIPANQVTKLAIVTELQHVAMLAAASALSLAQKAIADAQVELSTLDIKAIADKYYAIIPEVVVIDHIPVPVGLIKSHVSQAEFEGIVTQAFDRINMTITDYETILTKDVTALTISSAAISKTTKTATVTETTGSAENASNTASLTVSETTVTKN